MIRKTPGVAGGDSCIRNTRIAVWTLISSANQGASNDDLLLDFPGLNRFDLLAARAYYRVNKAEIDAVIAEHNQDEEGDVWVLCK